MSDRIGDLKYRVALIAAVVAVVVAHLVLPADHYR